MPDPQKLLEVTTTPAYVLAVINEKKILDEMVIQSISSELTSLVDARGPSVRLILDFGRVEHLSSAALGMLITLNKTIMEREGMLLLAAISPQIVDVFRITRLDKFFRMHTTVEQARMAIAAGK